MTSSDLDDAALRARARELTAQGYERMSVVDATRGEELAELYEELGNEVVVLLGAVPAEGQECTECLSDPGLVTLFVRKRTQV